ncbi:phage tail fiber protein [Klebsiella pneumoniae subsp. ozaenae]
MSVPNQTPYNIYTANGLTTVFAYEFYLISASDIRVTINGGEVASGYTLSGVGNTGGGEVTFLTAPAKDATIIFERVIPTFRLTDYQDNGDLLADTVNKDLDRLWMAVQRAFIYLGVALSRPLFGGGPFNADGYRIANLANPVNSQDAANKQYVATELLRTLRVPEESIAMIPGLGIRRGRLLAFNDQGNPISVPPESGSAADVMVMLASDDGAGFVGTRTGKTVQEEIDDTNAHFLNLDADNVFMNNGYSVEHEITRVDTKLDSTINNIVTQAQLFSDVETGLANTTSGQYFNKVVGSGGIAYTTYLNDNGSAVYQTDIMDASLTNKIKEQDTPLFSIADDNGISVLALDVNSEKDRIELSVDAIPLIRTEQILLDDSEITPDTDADILTIGDRNGLEVELVDLITQVASGGSTSTASDTAALLSADAAAYIAQNYNMKRHPVAVIRRGLNIWFVCGQSFTLGTAAKGILTRTDSTLGNLMLGQSPRGMNLNPSTNNTFYPVGGENKYFPLREVRQLDNGTKVDDNYSGNSTFGETILSGFLETLKDYHNRNLGVANDSTVTFAGSCCGTVGVSITALKKGATEGYYNRFLSCLSGHIEAASTSGYSGVQVAGIIWMQGQNDTGGMTTAEYLGHLTDIKSSMIADCVSATGQKEAPGFFIAQTGGMYVGNTQKLEVQMAQVGLAEQDTGAFFLHNDFPYPRPANHWYANSYRWAGCQYAKEIWPIVSGLNLNPFKPLDAAYDGKAIYVSFSPLYAPIVKQPFYTGSVMTDHADYGLTVIDASGTHYGSAITVEIASDTVMKITPQFTPSGAMTVVLGDANHSGGHNIADSDDQTAIYKWTYETGYGLDAGENITALVNKEYPLFNRSASYSISVRTL